MSDPELSVGREERRKEAANLRFHKSFLSFNTHKRTHLDTQGEKQTERECRVKESEKRKWQRKPRTCCHSHGKINAWSERNRSKLRLRTNRQNILMSMIHRWQTGRDPLLHRCHINSGCAWCSIVEPPSEQAKEQEAPRLQTVEHLKEYLTAITCWLLPQDRCCLTQNNTSSWWICCELQEPFGN